MGLRIAHLVPTDRIAYLLLRANLLRLREAGYAVGLICGRVGEWGEELRREGVEVYHIPFAREPAPATDLRCAAALYRLLRRERFALLHSHNPKGGLLGPVVGKLARVPVVVHTVHGFLFNENARGPHRWLALAAERWTASWCDHLLFQSQEDYAYARDHGFKARNRLHLVGNGIDERRFDPDQHPQARQRKRAELGLAEDHLVVGMVGRLVREKGFVEFFEMAGRVARQEPRARFLVVGIREEEQSDAIDPQALIATHGLEGRCLVLEQRRDMPELYRCMDLAVLPSHREGIPRALLEAGAMGVPIAASDIRGCREVIVDGLNGVLFPLKDVDAFTAGVRRLLEDEGERRRLGQAARERVRQEYTEARTAERLIGCYRQFLAGGPP
jgi:glycosyltransferase involved in cell wall biosynthesis